MSPLVDFFESLQGTLGRQFTDFRELLAVDRLSGGASMETYRLSIQTSSGPQLLCMRRGAGGMDRESVSAVGLRTEALLMRTAKESGVVEPEIYYELQPDDGVGVGFIMEWLGGETLGSRIVRSSDFDAVRPLLAAQCGRELAKIHAIDLDTTGLRGALPVLSPQEYLDQTWERYKAWDTPQPMIDFAGRWLQDNLPEGSNYRLVHNDFRNGNLMVDAQTGLQAVLDWETSHIGDPMRDIGWICTNSWRFGQREKPVGGFGDLDDLISGYEQESGRPVNRDHVKFWEVFGSFWWAIGCLGMTDQYRSGPDATVERPAIGRRTSECQIDCVNLLIPGPTTLLPVGSPDRQSDMPRLDELLVSVREFLHGDVMSATTGRTNFLARVAGNSLDIIGRELAIGPALARHETALLSEMLGLNGDIDQLRWRLVHSLRDGSIELDSLLLQRYLRDSVVNQVAIDQPKYSGFQFATSDASCS